MTWWEYLYLPKITDIETREESFYWTSTSVALQSLHEVILNEIITFPIKNISAPVSLHVSLALPFPCISNMALPYSS